MVQKIRAKEVEVITKDGECKLLITLELNINLNGLNSGSMDDSPRKEEKTIKEEIPFIVPDFESSKIKFGNITKIPKGD